MANLCDTSLQPFTSVAVVFFTAFNLKNCCTDHLCPNGVDIAQVASL